MPDRRPSGVSRVTVSDTCALLESILGGSARREIIDDLAEASDLAGALRRLRDAMRNNAWPVDGKRIALDAVVDAFDRRTRKDGFHPLHDWDGKADRINADTIPVDVLHFLIDKRGTLPADRVAVAILLDYYFLHVLGLLSLNVWEDGDPDENVRSLNRLLGLLQGQDGSGQMFARNAGTLLLLATSHYELHESGFDALLARVRALDAAHQFDVAVVHACSLGSHLRFGFDATYARSVSAMRDDNVVDYPWLSFALATLAARYPAVHEANIDGPERDSLTEAIANALTADPAAFLEPEAPAVLAGCAAERSIVRDCLHQCRDRLLADCAAFEPGDSYSPFSFFFNFSHNVLKGLVIDALLWGEASNLGLDDLLTGLPRTDPKNPVKLALARTLMGFARSSPDRIRGRLMPVIVYDPRAGRRSFSAMMRQLKESTPRSAELPPSRKALRRDSP